MERMPVPEPADRPMGILAEPNPDRVLHATLDGAVYARHPVRTHLVTDADDALEVVRRYATPLAAETVLVAVSERMVAITEGRSYPMTSIRPGRLARFLVRLRHAPGLRDRARHGRDDAAGDQRGRAPPRILLAAVVSGLTKPFGVHGLFYRIAGRQAAAIDGPTSYTIAPYNQAATLGPEAIRPGGAGQISKAIGVPVAVIDANDAGVATSSALGPRRRATLRRAPLRRQPARPGRGADAHLRRAPRRRGRRESRCRPEPRRRLTPP